MQQIIKRFIITDDGTPYSIKITDEFGREYNNIFSLNYNINADTQIPELDIVCRGSLNVSGTYELVSANIIDIEGTVNPLKFLYYQSYVLWYNLMKKLFRRHSYLQVTKKYKFRRKV